MTTKSTLIKLQLLQNKHKNLNPSAWHAELVESGLLVASQIPKEIIHTDTPVNIEGIAFDQSLRTLHFKSLAGKVCFAERIGLIDLGVQIWSLSRMRAFIHLLAGIKSVHYLKFHQSQFSQSAWSLWVQWLITAGVKISDIDLGGCVMTIPRVKAFAEMLASQRMVEKLDFAFTKWSDQHVKAFVWTLQSSHVVIKRVSLGSISAKQHGMLMLVRHYCSQKNRCWVFSTGVKKLEPKTLNAILSFFIASKPKVRSFIMTKQQLDSVSTELLYQMLTTAEALEHMALIDCVWDYTWFNFNEKRPLRVKKLYFDPGARRSGGFLNLVKMGYSIEREIGNNVFWLKA